MRLKQKKTIHRTLEENPPVSSVSDIEKQYNSKENEINNIYKAMKTLIIGLFFTLTLTSQAQNFDNYIIQPEKKEFLSQPARIILTYAAVNLLDAIGDGLNDKGNKGWGHTCQALSVGTLLMSPVWIHYDKSKWYMYPLTFISLRFSLFDPTYNATRGLPLTYYGTTSFWDKKVMQKIKPPDGLLYGRSLALIFSISVPFNTLKN